MKPFFLDHKENYLRAHYPAEKQCNNDNKDLLYLPAGYRMFGRHGLALIALQDDTAFACRIFNSSHINAFDDSKGADEYPDRFKGVIITGTSEEDSKGESSLYNKANNSFLRKEDRYPFIGIIRLKVNPHLLFGYGLKLIWCIKDQIKLLYNGLITCISQDSHLDYIVVDSYDSDELTVIGFSNGIRILSQLFAAIRSLQTDNLDIFKGKCKQHVFATCYASYGYDINYEFSNEVNSGFYKHIQDNEYAVNLLCETKPGHEDSFCKILKKNFKDIPLDRTISGGSIVISRIKLEDMERLCKLVKNNKEEFRDHLIRIKLTLRGGREERVEQTNWKHDPFTLNEQRIGMNDKRDIKADLTRLGVSKIERERLLSLCDLYNDCEGNLLQMSYFHDLLPSVKKVGQIVNGFLQSKELLSDIEMVISEEVSALESAFYNRMHNTMTPNAVLEYSGGVQQYIQALGYAYSKLVEVLAPARANSQYICITGSELVSSTATHIELNINHIIYPQLFATIAWKEAANFSAPLSYRFDNRNSSSWSSELKEANDVITPFISFIKSPDKARMINSILVENVSFVGDLGLRHDLCEAIEEGILDYAINDYLVFHYSFQRDFKQMWFFYWSIFLQTASTYSRKNEIRRKKFVMFLLRLFIVGLLDINENNESKWLHYIKEQKFCPFDFTLAFEWLAFYDKVFDSAKAIVKTLDFYQIQKALFFTLYSLEMELSNYSDDTLNPNYLEKVLEKRELEISKLESLLESGTVISSDYFCREKGSPENVICLMSAYLRVIKKLSDHYSTIRSVPRVEDSSFIAEHGHDHDTRAICDNFASAAPVLSDPGGGFFCLTPVVRKKYFTYSTIFFRALWDLSYCSK